MTTRKFLNRTISVFAAFLVLMFSMTLYSDRLDAANTARAYNVYDAQTGEFLRSYTLEPLADRNNSRSVIDTDTREPDWTKSGVVKIMDAALYRGTGFVVDDHVIATAAHCLKGKNLTEILLFNSDGTVSMSATPIEIHYTTEYHNYETNNYDYALITVKEDLSSYACFTLGVPLDNLTELNPTLKITGFPQIVNEETVNDEDDHMMYTSSNTIRLMKNHIIQYYVDSSSGNSGGPVYIEETRSNYSYNTVIAIHTHGFETYNFGTRITTDLIHFYMNNANLNWD